MKLRHRHIPEVNPMTGKVIHILYRSLFKVTTSCGSKMLISRRRKNGVPRIGACHGIVTVLRFPSDAKSRRYRSAVNGWVT